MNRKDLFTNEEFIAKRINQRFAHAKNRVMYYNQKANEVRHKLSVINKPLLKNYKICQELVGDKMNIELHKQFLKGRGFRFDVFTHFHLFNGVNKPAIYDFIIIFDGEDKIKIIKINNCND